MIFLDDYITLHAADCMQPIIRCLSAL